MLQQVLVLEQELVHASLGLQPCRRLRGQLVLQQVDLRDRREWVSVWEVLLEGRELRLRPPLRARLPELASIPPDGSTKKPFPAGTRRCGGESRGRRQCHTRARSANPAHGHLASLMEKPEGKGRRHRRNHQSRARILDA